eukprot:6214149-Pleurochrysis_carterae.AAC.1
MPKRERREHRRGMCLAMEGGRGKEVAEGKWAAGREKGREGGIHNAFDGISTTICKKDFREKGRKRVCVRERDRETEKARDRETERQKNRETERKGDRETETETDTHTHTHRERERESEREREGERDCVCCTLQELLRS